MMSIDELNRSFDRGIMYNLLVCNDSQKKENLTEQNYKLTDDLRPATEIVHMGLTETTFELLEKITAIMTTSETILCLEPPTIREVGR